MTFSNKTNKDRVLYDCINFSILAICLFCLSYCVIVKIENYSFPLLGNLFLSVVSLYFISSKFEITERTYFSKVTDILTMDNIKTFIAGFCNFSAFVLCFLLFLYPMFEFILWILSTFFPKLWPNTYSANWITDFAIKYLPYSFHPNCDKFSFFMANFIILILGAKLVEDEHFYIGSFLGGVLLYSFFDEQLFDLITGFAGFIGAVTISIVILALMVGAGSSGGSTSTHATSSESSNKGFTKAVNNNTLQTHIINDSHNNYRQQQRNNYKQENKKPQTKEREIACAYQHGNNVVVVDSKNSRLFPDKSGILMGYTNSSVSIKKGRFLYTYDTKGHTISQQP